MALPGRCGREGDTLVDLLVATGAFLGFLGITLGAGAVGSRFTIRSLGNWYVGLRKPDWTPPGSVIGLIWTALYILMAAAAWWLWLTAGLSSLVPWAAFAVQLALNVGWSALFFGARSPRYAFVEILGLWFAVLATILTFALTSLLAGLLLLPYLVWVSFAASLNFLVWRMNRPDAAMGPTTL